MRFLDVYVRFWKFQKVLARYTDLSVASCELRVVSFELRVVS